jgi:Tfp pilus assembly PilM family ATPase
MSVLFAGAKKEKVGRQINIINKAGLSTEFIGTVPEALCALLKFNDQLDKNNATLVVHIGDGDTAGIYVINDQIPHLTRDVDLGEETQAMTSKLAGEIQSSIDYFKRQFPEFEVSKIVIAGQRADAKLCEAITSQLGIACQKLDITKRLKSEIEISPSACVAAGLALIGLEKRKKAYVNLIPPLLLPKEEEILKPIILGGVCACIILAGVYFF